MTDAVLLLTDLLRPGSGIRSALEARVKTWPGAHHRDMGRPERDAALQAGCPVAGLSVALEPRLVPKACYQHPT